MSNVEVNNEEVVGKGNIWAQVIADSHNVWGQRLTTFRLHYPRFIHAEFMTHRMFSRNASSSRAIPVAKVLDQVHEQPATPIHWGVNQAGMQAAGEQDVPINFQGYCRNAYGDYEDVEFDRDDAWTEAADSAAFYAQAFSDAGYHKQVVNRIVEPFQFMNVVISATDYNNFFYLRDHDDADPNIRELAHVMLTAYNRSLPETLRNGEYHTPYVNHVRGKDGVLRYFSGDTEITVEDAIKISASCAAQASYRRLDTSLEKAIEIYDRLAGSEPIHASPFEHVATPFTEHEYMARKDALDMLERKEVDHALQVMYKGNFMGWTQIRKDLPNENILG
jgi:thymidylate synthase ThyX